MAKVRGKIVPLRDMIIGSDMNFGYETTKGRLVLLSDNGKTQGIHPRWCRVYAVGPKQTDVTVGQWICVEHGRWGRTVELDTEEGVVEVRAIDPKCVLLVSDEQPDDTAMRNVA